MPKSTNRIAIERILTRFNVQVPGSIYIFTDKSKSGWRIKFGFIRPSTEVVALVRRAVSEEFPTYDTRVWIVSRTHSYAVGGLAIKIFNN